MVTPVAPRPRNPATQARLQRETLWQIYVPLGVAVLALVVVMALTVFVAGLPVRSVWADVSLIYLAIFALAGGVVALALLVGLCVGLGYALRELPGYFKIAQDIMALIAERAAELSRKVAGIFIAPHTYVSAAQKALDSARSIIPTGRKQ